MFRRAGARSRRSPRNDGLVGAEGAFLTCSFWAVSALVEIGESDRASKPCEKVLCAAAPLELYAEELDPTAGASSATSRRGSRTSR